MNGRPVVTESEIWDSNPWWNDRQGIAGDKWIMEWEGSKIRYVPEIKGEIRYDFEPSNTVVYTLRGQRQVGKTTLVKLQIRDLLERGIPPTNIMYYTLETSSAKQDIVDAVRHWDKAGGMYHEGQRRYAFLDEVSSVPYWQKAIRWMVDTGMLKNCTMLVTGSHMIDLKRSAESLYGRSGTVDGGHDKVLQPMSFLEYVSATNKRLGEAISDAGLGSAAKRRSAFASLADMKIDKSIEKISMHSVGLDPILHEYMLTGGIPKIVNEKARGPTISEATYDGYGSAVNSEWASFEKNTRLLKQFLRAIIRNQGSHMSWSGLGRESDLGSVHTAMDYADTLDGMFMLSIVGRYDEARGVQLTKKDRKFYVRDPFYIHVVNCADSGTAFRDSIRYLQDEATRGRVVEGIVADHLIRIAYSAGGKRESFDYQDHVFYWKDDGGGKEVDFVLRGAAGAGVPIESKYRNSVSGRDLGGMYRFLDRTGAGGGIVVTRSDLGVKDGRVEVPAGVFLLLA